MATNFGTRRLAILFAAAFSMGAAQATAAAGDAYPAKPVRVIIPFAPGGSSDIVGRPITMRLTGYLGASFIIDNRGGGGGSIGAELAVKANPDGYTLLLVNSSYATNAAVYKLAYDPIAAVTPVVEIGYTPHLIILAPSVPVKSVKELVAYMKAHPGKLTFGTSGNGGFTHLATELFFSMAGNLKAVHVPYRSMSLGLIDMIGGQVQLMVGSIPPTMPHIRSGKLVGLAVTTAQRWPQTPELPTVAETVPGYEVVLWFGLLGPKGLPNAVVEKLNAAVNKALREEDLKKDYMVAGVMMSGGTPQTLAERIRSDMARWTKVVKEVGIKPE